MYPQQPIPTAADPDTQYLHSNSTITSSGSQIFSGFGTKEISVVVNVTASPTGTAPTLTVTMQEIDPGDLTAVFGTVATTSAINAIGVYTASLVATTGGSVKVSWAIGGSSSPTFTGVYSTVTSKLGINSTVTGSANVTAAQGTAAALSGAWPVKVTDGTNTLPTGDVVGRAIFEKITDGTNTAAVTASSALKVDGSAVTQPVSGTVTANIGTSGSLALDATLTGGTARTKVTDGTNNAAVKAASTAAVAGDPALVVVVSPNNSVAVTAASLPLPTGAATSANQTTLGSHTTKINDGTNTATVKAASTAAVASDTAIVVAISPNNSITASNPSVGSNNAAIPTSSTQVGGTDGTNLQAARVFDADTGAGTQYILGVGLRKAASGGSVEAGTSADPLRVDPTGTTAQPITDNSGSLTVDSTQLPAALVGGRLDENIGAWLGSTAPTVGSKTSANSIPVVVASDQAAIPITDNAGSLTVDGTVTANIGTTNGLALDATITGGTQRTKITDGTNNAAVKAASTAAVAADPAVVVVVSPNNTVAVTDNAGSLTVDSPQLPAALVGARLDVNAGAWLGSTAPTVGSKTSANSVPVVVASDQAAIPITDNAGSLTVDGTVTSNQGTAAALSGGWPVKITDGTNSMPTGDTVGRAIFEKITDGTNTAAVKAASTAAVAADPALVVAISPNNPISVSGTADVTGSGALGALNAAVQVTTAGLLTVGMQLAAGTLIGTITPEVSFDGGTTWVVTQFDDPATLTKSATIVFGSSNTATARTLVGVGGSGLTRVRVSAYTSGTANITIRATTRHDPSMLAGGAAAGTLPPSILQVGGSDGSALRALLLDSGGRPLAKITDGTNTAAVKAASTAAVAADPALVVAISPNNAVQIIDATNATSTLSNVSGSASSVTLLSLNTARKGVTIFNDSTAILYVKFGTTASTTSFTVRLVSNAYYEVPFGYTGRIDGIWASATGSARVTELT